MRVAKESSFIHFVYPFLFEANEFDARVEAFQNAVQQGCGGQLKRVWTETTFPEEELLSHVRNYLNSSQGAPATAHLWELNFEDMHAVFGLGDGVDWYLVRKKLEIPFQWGDDFWSAQLALFCVGVGFLTIRAKPTSERVEDWLDFLHYFRYVNGQMRVRVRAEQRTPSGQAIPFFPRPVEALQRDASEYFGAVLRALLQTGAFEGEQEPWWQEVYVQGKLIPFAALFVNEEPEQETGSQFKELLYRVHRFFPAERLIIPSDSDLDFESHPAFLPYVRDQWFIFSLEGGAFVARNAPETDFFRKTLPDHLGRQYFLLFLLALHQRFALMRLSQLVSDHWLQNDHRKRVAVFTSIRDQLLAFTARGYFTQVMQRENHHRCYCKWQEIFQVEALYREVSDEVREMHETLQMKRAESLNWFAWLLGPPALLLTLVEAAGVASPLIAMVLLLTGFAIGGLVLMRLQVVSVLPRRWLGLVRVRPKRRASQRPQKPLKRNP